MIKNKAPLTTVLRIQFLPIVIVILSAMQSIVFAQLPTTFQKVDLVTGLKNSVNFEFAPDGRVFIIDRYGQILIYKPATQTTVSAGFMDVFHDMEEGLLALVFDPQFATNQYIYVHYSHPTLPANRVSRFQMNGDQINLSSEVVMLEWTTDRNGYYHAAGDMDFDAQGNLYVAIGDNTNHTQYSPLNETDRNQSAERTSSNTNDLRGKILRIKPNPDGTYSVPAGNLFPNGVGGRPEIYVMGARNPYKIFVDKTNTNWLFWAEVGPDANLPNEKGPVGMDEINLVKSAGNYGWPYVSGKNEPYLNSYAQPNFYYDHANPVNISKWNTGAMNLPPAKPSWLDFFHGCYLAGPRYYFNSSINNARKLPSQFHQGLFYFDFNTSKIWLVHMDANGNVVSNQRFAENVITGSGFIDMEIGPDGQLYILEYGAGCCPANIGSGKLVRVDYTGVDANFAPVPNVSASPVSGNLPLTVNFSSQGTTDQDGDALTFEWDFQSDGTVDSNQPNPAFTYTQAGTFNALLRVTDSKGAVVGKSVLVYPGNNAATITFNTPPDGGMISWADEIPYQLTVSDAEDGNTTNGSINCSDVNFVPSFGHLTHSHDGLTINQCSGTFNLDPTSHDAQGQDDIYYVFKANYTDNDGLTSFGQVTLHPKIMEAEFHDAQNNTSLVGNTDALGGGVSSVRALSDNSYIMLDGRNLQNILSVSYRVATTVGGVIEVHADSPTGTLLSTVNLPITGALDRWTNANASITDPGGKHDLYFVFKKPGAINIVDLNYIEFIGPGVSTDPSPPNVYSLEVLSRSHIRVKFNEELNEASAEAVSNYSINNNITISSATLEDDKKTVHFVTSPLTVALQYELTIDNVTNLSGVAIGTPIVQPFTMEAGLVRLNSGGPLLNLAGVAWKADQYNQGGVVAAHPTQPISNTIHDVLYQSELIGNFTYNIPLPDPGVYNVKLHFAEMVFKNVAGRIFNVNIENGQGTLSNFDIYAKTGFGTALIESIDGIIVNDGFLNITFAGVKNNPTVSGIEIYYGNESAEGASLTIVNPANNLNVAQPFDISFDVQNQWIGNGGYHIHKMVDGVKVGDVFSTDPITFNGLSAGPHTIKLVLADANSQPTAVSDEVQVNVVATNACIDNPFPLSWQLHVLGTDLPYRAPQIYAADLDNDGYKDVIAGAWWFKNPGTPTGFWPRNVTGAPMNNMFLIHDLDRDGDPDILGTQGTYLGTQLAWARNDGKGNFTIYTNIPESAGFPPGSANNNTFVSGAAVGNYNGVQNIQIAIVWNASESTHAPVKMLTVPADPVNQTWIVNDIAPNAVGETINAVDVDKDGDLDLTQAKNWLRNDNGTWTTFSTNLTMPSYYEHHLVTDFDRNGGLDGVMTQIGDNADIFSFTVPSNPTQAWQMSTLATDVDGALSLDIADLDFDGDLDIVTGEWKFEKRLLAFENDLCNSGTWIKHVLHPGGSAGPDHHNGTQTADLDNDGDLDIISVGWDKRTPRIYINNSSTVGDNAAPVLANAIPDQNATGGTAFTYTFPANTFTDADGDILIYTATLTDGGSLPLWLTFTGTTRTFSGTPPSGGSPPLMIKLAAYDGKGGNALDEFAIIFPNVAPVVANPIPNQASLAETTFNFTFAANTFSDPNGDALIYTSALSSGDPLPPWITFTGTTRTFTANPAATNAGVYQIRVTASDNALTVTDVFSYTVTDPSINQAPVVDNPIPDVNAIVGAQFNFTFPANTFSDANQDNLTYTASLATNSPLPAWLTFNPDTRGFNGIPGVNDTGTLNVMVSASDGELTASDIFELNVEVPGSIRINSGGPSMSAYGVSFDADKNFIGGGTFSNNNITNISGTIYDQLYKTERFNVFSYEVPVPSGNYKVRLHFAEIYFGATGGGVGAVGKRVFNVTAEGQALLTNFDIYAEVGPMAAIIKEFDVPVTDGILNLNFVKVVENPKVNAVEIIPNVTSGNSAPLIANPIADQTFPSGSPLSFIFPTNTFTDPDGDVLTYSAALSNGSVLPSWLTFNNSTRTFSGTPSALQQGMYQIKVTASDNSLNVSDVFSLTIAPPPNQPPVVANLLPDQSAVRGTLFTFTFAANTFTDPENDPLTYSAALSNGNPLPSWLTFNNTTRTFSGTPSLDDEGLNDILVTASDNQSSVSDIFSLAVSPPANQPPIVGNLLPDQSVVRGTLFTFTFAENSFTDPDNDVLTYSAALSNGNPLPSWLSFDNTTRTFSGTPYVEDDGVHQIRVTAMDNSSSVSDVFAVTVTAPSNQSPIVSNAISDQSAVSGTLFTFTFATNVFSDPNADPLSYTATLDDNSPLPGWLTFNASTRTFSGTPGAGDAGSMNLKVTASDGTDNVSDVFVLTVISSSSSGIRINSGGPQLTAYNEIFDADKYFSGGATYTNSKIADIAGTADDELYKSERVQSFSYAVPVQPGTYRLRLHFAEIYYGATGGGAGGAGLRVFSVSAEGQMVLTNFDIYAEVGAMRAVIKEFLVNVTDGMLNVNFLRVVRNPKVSAIEVIGTTPQANRPPVVANAIPDQNATVGSPFNFTFASNTFSDPDSDPLSYAATLTGGAPLPLWLTFTPSTRTFSGTAGSGDMGNLNINVAASDGKGGTVTDGFQLAVGSANSPPVVANIIPDQNATVGSPFNFIFASNTFSDADSDPLTYSAMLTGGAPLPSWLTFTSSTRSFSGTPASGDAGNVTVNVTASDGKGGSITDAFQLTVEIPNSPPVVSNVISNQSATAGSLFNFAFASNTFSDPDSDPLTYTATLDNGAALPAWITFSASTRTFTGTPAVTDAGSINVKVTASDGTDNISDIFVLTVISSSSGGIRINSGGPQLTAYNEIFDADKYFSGGGTYTNSNIVDIAGTTDDELYKTERVQSFSYAIPVQAGTYRLRLHFAEIFYGATGGGAGGAGLRVFSVAAEGQTVLANFDIYAEVGAMRAIIKEFLVNVTDGTLNINFIRVVRNPKISAIEVIPTTAQPNQPPAVVNPIPDQIATVGSPFNFTFASNTFSDPDTDPLTYSATLTGGAPLPSWLTFTPSTRTFSGTPASGNVGNLTINVAASDGKGASVSDAFQLAVVSANSQPVVANAIPDQTASVGVPFAFAFAANTFSDPNSDPLTYSATLSGGAALPSWLTFTPSTRTFSGTPASANVGNLTINVAASDGKGGTVSDAFQLAVVNVNSPPVVVNSIPDQNATVAVPFTFTFASNTFSDPNGDPLAYSAKLSGGAPLPSWLMFTPSTRTFSGTPSSANVGNLTIHVEASDGKGGVIIDGFQLTVSPPPPGTRINTGGTSFTATSGAVFSADTYFSGGGTYTTTSTNDIAGTTDDFIYRSERYNMSAYNVPLPSGTYLLTLHFAEIWFGAPGGSTGGVGKRVFNVSAEGTPLLSNFDIYAQAGGAMIAVVRQFQVTVTDGVLNIAFTKVIQSPKISAIEIVASSSTTSSSSARISTSGIQTDPAAKDFLLAQEETFRFGAYPNPFRTRATLEYTPVETEEISMQLLDVQGFVVDDVYAGEVDGGTSYHFELDGSQLATGIYYVRVQSKEGSRFIRLAVVGDR